MPTLSLECIFKRYGILKWVWNDLPSGWLWGMDFMSWMEWLHWFCSFRNSYKGGHQPFITPFVRGFNSICNIWLRLITCQKDVVGSWRNILSTSKTDPSHFPAKKRPTSVFVLQQLSEFSLRATTATCLTCQSKARDLEKRRAQAFLCPSLAGGRP